MQDKAAAAGESLYSYNARDASGRRTSGQIAARDSTDASRRLRLRGLYPIDVSEAAPAAPVATPVAKGGKSRRLTQKERASLIARLAKLTGSRISLDRALSILAESRDGVLATSAGAMRLHIREGGSLLDGLRIHAGVSDAATLALVRGAEVSGDLAEALATAAGILQQRLMLVRRIATGLLYPSLLMIVALIAVGLIMIAIIPQFRPLIEDRMDAVPFLGRMVFGVSAFLSALWPVIVAGFVVVCAGMWFLHRQGRAMPLISSAAARIPLVRDVIQRNQIMVVLHILGALLQRDVVLSEALRVVSGTAPVGRVQDALKGVSARIEAGQVLSAAFSESDLMPPSAVEMIRIGEETGDLSEMATRAAQEMREAADQSLERFLTLFQPALIIGVGLVVGLSLYALFSAIVAVNSIAF